MADKDSKDAKNRRPPTGSLASVEVVTPASPQKPNNPFYLEAEKLVAAKDWDGLEALDKKLAEANYAPDGITRTFIDAALREAQ